MNSFDGQQGIRSKESKEIEQLNRGIAMHSPSFHEESGLFGSINMPDHVDEEQDMQGVLAARKNLFGSFEKASEQKGNSRAVSRPPLAPNANTSHTNCNDNVGLSENRLSSLSSSTSSSTSVRNPAAKSSMLAVYLRIRPPSCAAITENPIDCTIEIVDHLRRSEGSDDDSITPRDFPTSILTYPPMESQAYKSIRQTGDGNNSGKSVVVNGVKKFTFQRVFGPSDSQRNIYDVVAAPLVVGVFPTISSSGLVMSKGQSALLFAYGITNAGKTYTIMGDDEGRKCGIIPRAIDGFLKEIARREKNECNSCQFQLNASFYEIYNEQVNDLLRGDLELGLSKKSRLGTDRKPLKIREDKNGYIFVQGLSKHKISSVAEGFQLAMVAKNRRQTCSNNINGESSRSHSIYQLELACKDSNGTEHVTNMCIVDLAGSERARRTGNALKSTQQREAAQINASLMNLMQCIQQLSSNQHRPNSAGAGVVPFRGSKLSHLFMNHLTGASTGKTAMIVNVNPAAADFDETQHVLSYAVVAKNVRINSEDYQKKISVISAYKGVAHKASYDSDNDGRKKRSADRSKENSASRKVAKIAEGALRFPPLIIAKKIESATKQGGSDQVHRSASEFSRENFDQLLEKSSKLIETNLCLEAELESYRKQALVIHSAELLKSSTLEHENKMLIEEIDSLKERLIATQEETFSLKNELTNKEFEIRAEVGDEFEKQIAKIREQYEGMRRQQEQHEQDNNTSILVQSTRKIQQDRAEDLIDDLMDKIEDCEEELQRMRESHNGELEKLMKAHRKALKAKDIELENVVHFHQVMLAAKEAEIEKMKIELNMTGNEEFEDLEDDVSSVQEEHSEVKGMNGLIETKSIDRPFDLETSCESAEMPSTFISEDKVECFGETDVFEKNFDKRRKDESCTKENIPVENNPNENSSHVRLLRQGRCSEVACEIVTQHPLGIERGPLENASHALLNVCPDNECEENHEETTLRMRLRSRKIQRT